MCGICGIVSLSNQIIEQSFIKKMCHQIYHRGPDAEGYYVKENVALGMRRLRIIDLNTGDQPIFNEDKSICIVFNGEIYNFKELKKDLIQKGHKFYTLSDTEVILHLYEEYSEKCLDKLRGMFTFAIWDKKEKKLFLARDRLGIKPLYYTITPKYFLFASELKSILIFPDIKKELDFTALSDFFTFLYVPAPRTIFKNIYKLLPGHYLILKNRKMEIRKHWDLKFEEKPLGNENDYIEKFLELFEEAVKLRLISDVPLGAFLSGGTDSSFVVAMMSKLSNKPVETFSIGYEKKDKYFDERQYSRIVAKKFNTHHHEFILKPNNIDELVEKIITHFDEPFADASAIPNYILSKQTKKYVTVALSGLGGDELCAGYERYLGCLLAEKYRRLPSFLTKKIIPALINHLPDSSQGNHFNERLKRFVKSANYPFLQRYFQIVATFNEEEKKQLFTPEVQKFIQRPSDEIFYDYCPNTNHPNLNNMSLIDFKTYLVDDLLTLTDRMSMAHALETRVPFLDHKLVEFFATIPTYLKLKGLNKKYLLKKAAERLLPKEVIYRKKMGFSVPLVIWFRNELKDYINDILSEKNIKRLGYFNHPFILQTLNIHLNGKANYDEKLWALVNFIKWYDKYLK
ncbi:Asparagine synthetase [glutamine-hydrolyzing] 1 [Candidatus Methanoperedenaceae archaeon GB37]|nr:Asparagine synthetase [glutamine-hydrolyzing] 1 [Candidatus Methanoperedenaceae archaeon GB37]